MLSKTRVGAPSYLARHGTPARLLEPYAPTVPGFFLYDPSLAQRSAPLRLFVEALKELPVRPV